MPKTKVYSYTGFPIVIWILLYLVLWVNTCVVSLILYVVLTHVNQFLKVEIENGMHSVAAAAAVKQEKEIILELIKCRPINMIAHKLASIIDEI